MITLSTTSHPSSLSPFEREMTYNGLDCCITAELLETLLNQTDNHTRATYEFSRSLQAPVLEMRIRGILIDQARRGRVVEEFHQAIDKLERQLDRIVLEGVGLRKFNWRSPNDLKELFYDRLHIPPVRYKGRVTVDRNALEKMEAYSIAQPIISHLIAMRDIGKKLGMLQTDIDSDGRMRTSYNIAGTDTGRLSSSLSEFGTGTNLQNITESLRSIFIADPGYKLAYFDAEQGESRVVGAIEWNLFGDGLYLNACEGGDLHTSVAKLVWPTEPWPGNPKGDRGYAEQPYYRHYDRRFMCKKIGHGTNYGGKPRTLAQQSRVELSLIEDFQPKYFAAFPAHSRWHQHVERELRSNGSLTSLTGRRRQFWGRLMDDSTLRAAIAYDPQGSLADIVNTGMLQVWRARSCILLMQIHDAIIVQYPETLEDVLVPQISSQLSCPITLRDGRIFTIPYGCQTGWNWGHYSDDNPDGLKSYSPSDNRTRTKTLPILDRRIR